jgi:hypothetical protein
VLARPTLAVQCKLHVASASDPLEREADAVADRVVSTPGMPEPAKAGNRHDPDDEIHGKLTGPPPDVTDGLETAIRGLGAGEPLPAAERAFLEPRFGHDFGHVRIHAGPDAQAVSAHVQARAFTRGHHIAFGAGEYAPGTTAGRRLLAHELTHVVQQEQGAPATVQRDLATPPPARTPAAQPDLTPAQITAAIRFNRALYDEDRTRQIQDLVGTTPTGTWTDEDVVVVASLQEEFGLHKDGMVGPRTFDFLDRETRGEKLARTDANCLLAFNVAVDAPTVGAVVGGQRSITGHFAVSAQFSRYCGCADYEYRQFIRGHWNRIRGGVVTDLGATFNRQPAGGLTPDFREDGNNTTPALNYGHRDQPNEGTDNGYFDDAKATAQNQASGCHYRADDITGGPDPVLPGDVFDVRVAFRGEIRRKGRVVQTQYWSAVNGRFPVP